MNFAALVLAGGQSRRMGRPKATLPFGSEPMLRRIVRILGEVASPICVAAAAGQSLPELPADVLIARDRRPNLGPLEGLAVGLRAVADRADRCYVSGCDAPLVKPEFVLRVALLSEGADAALPHVGGRDQPLAAVYRTELAGRIDSLLAAGHRRLSDLLAGVRTRRIAEAELIDADPALDSLLGVNTPEAYRDAIRRAGGTLPPPAVPRQTGGA